MYSEKVMDHFNNPRNVGEIEDASGVGTVGNAKCGDIMRMYLDIDDNTIWVTDYKMPEGTALSPYESSQEINLKFQENKWIDPTAYYLPETKNWISDFGKQIYMLSLTVESNGQEYELTPKQFPNLESLVRGTHVKVHAKISDVSPGAEGEVELEAQVVDWISEPEIKGDWEEVNSTTEIP